MFIGGQDIGKIENMADFRASTDGFISQLHNLLPTLTAQVNLEVPMAGRSNAAEGRARAVDFLGLVELPDRRDHLPSQQSGG